jgi:hypothetical protein
VISRISRQVWGIVLCRRWVCPQRRPFHGDEREGREEEEEEGEKEEKNTPRALAPLLFSPSSSLLYYHVIWARRKEKKRKEKALATRPPAHGTLNNLLGVKTRRLML